MSLVESAPDFSTAAACDLVERWYGIRATALPLASERDQNFLLLSVDAQAAQATPSYVLKIANAQEEHAILDLQNQALAHIAATGTIPAPQLIQTKDGQSITTVTDAQEQPYFVRLLSYLPGSPLGELSPHSPSLLRELHLSREAGQDIEHL